MKYDLAIVGSGPAGLATAAHAQANGLSYVLLERTDHLSDTIYAYQARKFVMAEPVMIPARGDIPFEAGSREAILAAWQQYVEERRLNIDFGAEVKSMKREGSALSHQDRRRRGIRHGQGRPRDGHTGQSAQARMSRRRRSRTSSIASTIPPSMQDQDILVVGAGDSALEIAIALSDENRVGLVVRGPEITRANEILTREVLSRQASGRMTIYFNTTAKEVFEGYADLSVRGDVTRVPAELIFLKLGADAAAQVLRVRRHQATAATAPTRVRSLRPSTSRACPASSSSAPRAAAISSSSA